MRVTPETITWKQFCDVRLGGDDCAASKATLVGLAALAGDRERMNTALQDLCDYLNASYLNASSEQP